MRCPSCRSALTERRFAFGRFWQCDRCGGRAITVELLRRAFTAESINPLWRHAISNEGQPGRPCPLCARAMLTVCFAQRDCLPIDICKTCHLVWLDSGEIESLTPLPPKAEPASRSPEQRQAIAKVKAMAEGACPQDYGKVWHLIGAILDLGLRSLR